MSVAERPQATETTGGDGAKKYYQNKDLDEQAGPRRGGKEPRLDTNAEGVFSSVGLKIHSRMNVFPEEKMASVEEKVKSIICEQLGIGEDEVKADKNFVDDLGADSLDIVELVMAMEEQFEIEIPDEDAEKIQSVNDAVTYIQQHS